MSHGSNRKASREGMSSMLCLLGQTPPLSVWFATAGALEEPKLPGAQRHRNSQRNPKCILTVQLERLSPETENSVTQQRGCLQTQEDCRGRYGAEDGLGGSLEVHRGRGDVGRERKGNTEEEAILGREIEWAKA